MAHAKLVDNLLYSTEYTSTSSNICIHSYDLRMWIIQRITIICVQLIILMFQMIIISEVYEFLCLKMNRC